MGTLGWRCGGIGVRWWRSLLRPGWPRSRLHRGRRSATAALLFKHAGRSTRAAPLLYHPAYLRIASTTLPRETGRSGWHNSSRTSTGAL